jgi:NAD(P)-dependent dehydrogenase (short-subunit alcohol dehydrogenase family)
MDELQGRVAVVTGGGSGIGRGIALACAGAGLRVAAADIDQDAADAVAAEICATGSEAIGVRVDVADSTSVARLRDIVEARFGAVHVLANNAGVMPVGPLADATADDWRWTFGVNVLGAVAVVDAFLPLLRANAPGHIVNTASMAALAPRLTGHLGVYSASKGALLVYSEVLRAELDAEGIGVSALCPGPVQTRIWESERNRPEEMGSAGPSQMAPARLAAGLDPLEVGRMVIEGIRRNTAYILTNEGSRARIEERFGRVLADSIE